METAENSNLTPEAIRDYAVARFATLAPGKYDRGQEAHGGLLTERCLVDEIEQEALDLFIYVAALRLKIERLNNGKAQGKDERGAL